MKFYETYFSYDYSFPAVSLAYFLRYPNPYSRHVLSTDVIDRYIDPVTQRLHTVRLHLKRSKIPAPVLNLLPKSVLGTTNNNAGQSFVLEKSVVDAKEGWMETENKNLEWTGVLSVIERQTYTRHTAFDRPSLRYKSSSASGLDEAAVTDQRTDVKTVVTFQSHLGEKKFFGNKARKVGEEQGSSESADNEESSVPKRGLFSKWSTASIQRSLELIGAQRTKGHVSKSMDGMIVVLERLRQGGLIGVLEGMKRDREGTFGHGGPWKRVWQNGADGPKDENQQVDIHINDE
ncbi:MAG: hypothetical protein M1837_001274 [Sclerophora amabilis]|nr:MAG: hypothetical protein M1837_001274 [Sclerophora amabilis]